jgi:hypothetical protein
LVAPGDRHVCWWKTLPDYVPISAGAVISLLEQGVACMMSGKGAEKGTDLFFHFSG